MRPYAGIAFGTACFSAGTDGSNPVPSRAESVSAVKTGAVGEKPGTFGGGLLVAGDVRRGRVGRERTPLALFLWRGLLQSHLGNLRRLQELQAAPGRGLRII